MENDQQAKRAIRIRQITLQCLQPAMNDIISAHSHCSSHRMEVLTSTVCGCFSCLEIFIPAAIKDWTDFSSDATEEKLLDLGTTALCPCCGIDSVIGSNSGYPISTAFLSKMQQHWF